MQLKSLNFSILEYKQIFRLAERSRARHKNTQSYLSLPLLSLENNHNPNSIDVIVSTAIVLKSSHVTYNRHDPVSLHATDIKHQTGLTLSAFIANCASFLYTAYLHSLVTYVRTEGPAWLYRYFVQMCLCRYLHRRQSSYSNIDIWDCGRMLSPPCTAV